MDLSRIPIIEFLMKLSLPVMLQVDKLGLEEVQEKVLQLKQVL